MTWFFSLYALMGAFCLAAMAVAYLLLYGCRLTLREAFLTWLLWPYWMWRWLRAWLKG